ncbi:hypothetical protein [Nonomuraea sp. NPDC050202]|uniref:hypothetical protein n=1 Tax=Nonomuraea sp. NPDC050202 TaxID=3155035 RepID=UPI0033ED9176
MQPILRYDLGDSVLLRPDPCPCGHPGPAVRVQGRTADLLTFPGPGPAGEQTPVTLPPLPLATLLEAVPGPELFQIVQTAPATLRIRLHPPPVPTPRPSGVRSRPACATGWPATASVMCASNGPPSRSSTARAARYAPSSRSRPPA